MSHHVSCGCPLLIHGEVLACAEVTCYILRGESSFLCRSYVSYSEGWEVVLWAFRTEKSLNFSLKGLEGAEYLKHCALLALKGHVSESPRGREVWGLPVESLVNISLEKNEMWDDQQKKNPFAKIAKVEWASLSNVISWQQAMHPCHCNCRGANAILLNVCLGVVSPITVLASVMISLRLCEWIFLKCCLLMICCFSTVCHYNLFSVSP